MTITEPADTADGDTTPAATPQPAVQVDDFARQFGDSLEWVTDVNECQNCGAPGGYLYCSDGCRIAANPDDYPDYDDAPTVTAADFGPLTDITDPWASDARNHL